MEKDINLFRKFLADNILNLEKVSTKINSNNFMTNLSRAKIEPYKLAPFLNMRSTLFPDIVKTFIILALVFCTIFANALAFVVFNILKKY